MKKLSFILWLVVNLFYAQLVISAPLPTVAVPGGIARVKIPTTSTAKPQAFFQGNRLIVLFHKQSWYAIVGIPLATQAGVYTINWQVDRAHAGQQSFTVQAKAYPKQYLTIKEHRKVIPNKLDMQRIQQEQATSKQIRKTWTKTMEPILQLSWPVRGRISSDFGLQRFYNNQPRSPHAGLDIAAPTGTPVKAPAAGRVLAVGDFFFSGRTIYLDHGQGFISMYAHLSEIKVKPGQVIQQNQVIAKVGRTGRATGPHLHWGVMLNTAYVNPLLLVT